MTYPYNKVNWVPGTTLLSDGLPVMDQGIKDGQLPFQATVMPEQYGALGNGTTNDASAFQQALDYISGTLGEGVLLLTKPTYKLNSAITINPAKVSVLAPGGTTLDLSGVTSGSAVTYRSTLSDPNLQPITMGRHCTSGVRFLGGNVVGVVGVDISGINNVAFSGFHPFYNCIWHNWRVGVSYYSAAHSTAWYNCIFNCPVGTCFYHPSGGINYGENLAFFHCDFFNSLENVRIDNVYATARFISSSFDYSDRMVTANGGLTLLDGCHIETSGDSNYLFYCTGDNVGLKVTNSTILLTGVRDDYELGYSDTVVRGHGMEFSNCEFGMGGLSYGKQTLIGGTGRAIVRNLSTYWADIKVAGSDFGNYLNKGSFDSGTVLANEWTLSSDPPTIDTTTFRTGTGSVRFRPTTNGNTVSMSVPVPIKRGERVSTSFYFKSSGLGVSGRTFQVQVDYLNLQGNAIASNQNMGEFVSDVDWTLAHVSPQDPPPKGVHTVRLRLTTVGTWQTTTTMWIDDMNVAVH